MENGRSSIGANYPDKSSLGKKEKASSITSGKPVAGTRRGGSSPRDTIRQGMRGPLGREKVVEKSERKNEACAKTG